MTTIVYRDGVLASDTRAYSGDRAPIGYKQKIFWTKASNGETSSVGISTPCPGLSEEIREWFVSEKDGDAMPQLAGRGFSALEVFENGEVYFYNDNFVPSGPLHADWFAIGSGAEYAIGALAMGATAIEAVEVAKDNDSWTGGVVQHIRVLEAGKGVSDMPVQDA